MAKREAEVTDQELAGIGKHLQRFLRRFDDCIKTRPSRRHLRTYIGGQTSRLERKSIEPMALEADVAPRTLQEFLSFHRWDHEAVRRRVQTTVAAQHADANAIGVIDETSVPKKGDKTPGVQRQHCGATGKTDNCVLTVHLGYVTHDFATLVDSDLYLPEESWAQDRERCRDAGIPDEVGYRPQWQIALDLLDRAAQHGIRLKYVAADEFYGRARQFRNGVAARGWVYVVEIPCNLTGWQRRPATTSGPQGQERLGKGERPARRVDRLWLRGGPSWELFHIKDTEKGPVLWHVRATRFSPKAGRVPGPEGWLLVARNIVTGEVKYFLSNAPAGTPVEALLHVAFSRAHIEQLFERAKGDIGLDHFEVRKYTSLQRHLILSMVSLLFLAQETGRLRGKKPVVEYPASAGSRRSAA